MHHCTLINFLQFYVITFIVRTFFSRSGQDYITIGGTEISYNNSFRLYMTTSKANPHFLPAVCIAVTIINFGITFEGLQVN